MIFSQPNPYWQGVVFSLWTSSNQCILVAPNDTVEHSAQHSMVNVNSSGKRNWTKVFHCDSIQQIFGITEVSDGLVFCGGFAAFLQDSARSFLFKTDTSGNPLWYKQYGGTPVGNYFYETNQVENNYLLSFGATYKGAGQGDLLLMKTDSIGNVIWSKTYGGADFEGPQLYEFADVEYLFSNGIIMVSLTLSFNTTGALYIVKTNTDGDLEWSKTLLGVAAGASQIIKDAKGGFMIHSMTQETTPDQMIINLDSIGNVIWSKKYGSIGIEGQAWHPSIVQTIDKGFAFIGRTESFGGVNILLIKTDSLGNLEWAKIYGDGVALPVNFFQTEKGFVIVGSSGFIPTALQEPYIVFTDLYGNSGCNERDVTDSILVTDVTSQVIALDVTAQTIVTSPFIPSFDMIALINDTTVWDSTLCFCDVVAKFTSTHQNDTIINFANQSQNYSSLLWDFGDGTSSTDINPQHIFSSSQTYTIKLIATQNDCVDTAKQVIITPEAPEPKPDPVIIPNLITMSGNQSFEIKNLPSGSELLIYDLLGRIIFNSTNYTNNWGGASAGAYYYILILPDGSEKKGYVIVVK